MSAHPLTEWVDIRSINIVHYEVPKIVELL